MSREIRRVPVGWEHPTEHNPYWAEQAAGRRWRGDPDPMLHAIDEQFVSLLSPSIPVAQAEWDAEFALWKAGTHEGLEFYRKYHSRDGFVYRDGERSFNPIRLWSSDGETVVEEHWVEDVDITEARFFANHHWPRPEDDEARMPYFGVPDDELGWCLYQTVSEGTPVTPVFATAEELIDYLATVGEDFSQKPMRREAAEALVRGGWAPSGAMVGGKFYSNEEALMALDATREG